MVTFSSLLKIKNWNEYSKFKHLVLAIATNPFLISLVLAIVIILSLPSIFNKYNACIVGKDYDNRISFYADLDNDGISEQIMTLIQPYEDFTSWAVTKNNKYIDQWNFNGRYIGETTPFWSDIDGDGLKEIFVFVLRDDKIFMSCINPLKSKFLIKDKFVTDYHPMNKVLDCTIDPRAYYDSNKDGIKEYYFSTMVGHSKQPRAMFAFDLAKDTILTSPKSCAAIVNTAEGIMSNDSSAKFMTATNAFGNCDRTQSYSDSTAWLMGFNYEMKYSFEPIKIGVYPSHSRIIPFRADNKNYFIVVNIYIGVENFPCTFYLFDGKGEVIKKKTFPYTDEWQDVNLYYDLKENSNYFTLIRSDGEIELLDGDFKVVGKKKIPELANTYFFSLDIDQDGHDELIFLSKNLENLIITRNNFSSYVVVNCPGVGALHTCTVKLNGKLPPELFAQFQRGAYIISYGLNPLYYLRIPIYAAIYSFILLIILLIQKAQRHQVEIKYKTEKQIAELQLKSIKNQIDPHFTLNIINSIGSLFYKQDNDKANYVFGKYSKMLRSTILNSDKILTTLSEELEYVKTYLELEQFRSGNRFKWEAKLDNHADLNLNVPKMLIHTFAENSVKHGLRHLEKDGMLLISVTSMPDEHTILISDNGIGRTAAQKLSTVSTGKGLQILDQILDLYYNLVKLRITYKIKDIYNGKTEPAGTEVLIKIPL